MSSAINAGPKTGKADFLRREPFEVYRAKSKDYLTSHALADFRRCPLLYRKKQLGLIPDRDSDAFLVGRAAHTLILEGRERYEAEYAVGGPVNPRTGQPFGSNTKAFAEWAERIGKPALDDSQAALVEQMAASVHDHPVARELLRSGVAEGVVRTRCLGHDCQARFDFYDPRPDQDMGGIVDLKTCYEIEDFELDIERYGYRHQVAFYVSLAFAATRRDHEVHLIAVEKREPFRCGVWHITRDGLMSARKENELAMRRLMTCMKTQEWPTGYETVRIYP